jgi:hypothetical protein
LLSSLLSELQSCRQERPEGGWRSPTKASVYVYECDPKPRRHRAAAASGRELSVELAKLQACAWCVGLEASPPQFCQRILFFLCHSSVHGRRESDSAPDSGWPLAGSRGWWVDKRSSFTKQRACGLRSVAARAWRSPAGPRTTVRRAARRRSRRRSRCAAT